MEDRRDAFGRAVRDEGDYDAWGRPVERRPEAVEGPRSWAELAVMRERGAASPGVGPARADAGEGPVLRGRVARTRRMLAAAKDPGRRRVLAARLRRLEAEAAGVPGARNPALGEPVALLGPGGRLEGRMYDRNLAAGEAYKRGAVVAADDRVTRAARALADLYRAQETGVGGRRAVERQERAWKGLDLRERARARRLAQALSR